MKNSRFEAGEGRKKSSREVGRNLPAPAEETFHIIIHLSNPINKKKKLFKNLKKVKPDKLQTIFIRWLNAALQDPRWRSFIRARLQESELPVIDLAHDGDTPATLTKNAAGERARGPKRVIVVR